MELQQTQMEEFPDSHNRQTRSQMNNAEHFRNNTNALLAFLNEHDGVYPK